MSDLFRLIWCGLIGLFRSRAALEAEILLLRHQLNILRRATPRRVALGSIDRLVFVGLYRLAPGVLEALKIVTPETLIRWHRIGFRGYWRWKSRPRGGRRKTPTDIRNLIREMSMANPLWGAPRIHGELLKLGIDVGQTTVAKYMARRRRPPSQGWKTFLRNHADGIVSMDLFVVPTISFRLLYGFLILRHGRRDLVWLDVTATPSAEWIARQLTEAYGFALCEDRATAASLSAAAFVLSWVLDKKVFQERCSLPSVERATATDAGYFTIRRRQSLGCRTDGEASRMPSLSSPSSHSSRDDQSNRRRIAPARARSS